jgi:hypothetical protein
MLRKDVALSSGAIFTLYHTPLTAAERERVNKDIPEDGNGFGMAVLIRKATDENGAPLFSQGDIATLKNEIRDEDLQKLMMAVLVNGEGAIDMKSTEEGATS